MLDYKNVIEKSKAYKVVDLDLSGSRLSHAYLFINADNNYLTSFAEVIAKKFINNNQTEDIIQKNNLRIDKRIHPDVNFYGETKNVDVSVVSDIIELSNVSPFEADKKIFVILNVQNMNESAQNKILKSIEEPPKNTFYILCANSVSRILQTILSRVKRIELDELLVADISSMLISKGVDEQKALIYASCANGNGEFAEKLATDDGFIDFFNQIVTCLYNINGSRDVLNYASIFTSKAVDKEEFFNIAMLLFRDIMMILTETPEFVICKNVLAKLKVISSTLNIEAVQTMIDVCLKEKEKLHFNVSQTAVVDDFLLKLAEVKVKCRRL